MATKKLGLARDATVILAAAMKVEISFPGPRADQAGVLSQELRLALLRSGADPGQIQIVKERADTMDVGSILQIVMNAASQAQTVLEHYVAPAFTLSHCAACLYDICNPANSGIRIKTSRGVFEFSANEVDIKQLKRILEAADQHERRAK
ncbi:MAG TPA: hypothetical protein VEN29_12615 [Casimicrobiaceae bacterium]|nr:hypothetical protein [Casimicrobiaceae bacterium]